jgi:hypothetical protein
MSAATVGRAPLPLYHEGLAFWEQLARECQRHAETVNSIATDHGVDPSQLVELKFANNKIVFVRGVYPSTEITATLNFERWGPLIRIKVTGHQEGELRFYPEEQEVPIARDLDNRIVAVFGEGRSYSPSEVASYLAQHLRRSFPEMSLPCVPAEFAY